MLFFVVVTVLGLWVVGGQASDFTINGIKLEALPSTKLNKSNTLELKCVVMFAKSTGFVLNSTFTFYADDDEIHTVISTKDQVSYKIPTVMVSNTGRYTCEVSVAGRKKKSEDVDIKVTGLSSPLINVSRDNVSEGEKVTVRCEAPEEWSVMVFTFYKINKDGRESKAKPTKTNSQEFTFLIKEGEDFLQFQCDVKLLIIDETSPGSAMKTVTVVAPFSQPRIEVLPSLNFTEGKNMSVKCSFQEGRKRSDDVKLTLQKDGHIIHSSTTNSLSYSRVSTVDDMGNYTCKVESRTASKSNSTKIVIVELFPRPRLTLERSATNEYVNDGDVITLKCSVAGLAPERSSSLDYKFIVDGGKRTTTRPGGKFLMTAMARFSGSYVCQVTISNITKISEPQLLQIYAPVKNPVLTHIMRSNKTVVLGDTLELTCKCESGTPPITYSLLRGKDLLDEQTMTGDKEARFLVNSSKSHDLGLYRCQATNRNTQSSGKYSNTVNVTVIIPISSVQLTIIPPSGDVEEGSELSLICQVTDGTWPITFTFYRKKGNEIRQLNVTETKKSHASHQVQTFSKQEEGAYFCTATNRAHKEVRSDLTDARAVLATWKKAVIGMFVVLVILAAIAICAYLHTDKKKKGIKVSSGKSRSSKPVTTKSEKPAGEMKAEYIGSIGSEEELQTLKVAEDSTGNHEVEQTEADGADTQQDPSENNHNRTEDVSEANNHT